MDSFTRGAYTFDVLDRGPADGEAIVLLHGFPQDAHSFDGLLPALHDAGYRTLAPLQRGYSPGARPTARSAYKGGELVGDVLALLDAADLDRAHVVGHDWGAGVAWELAYRAPARVRSLVSISTPHPQALIKAGPKGQLLKSWYMFAFQLPWAPEAFIGLGASRGALAKNLKKGGVPADAAARYEELMSDPLTRRGAVNWYRGISLSLREPVGRITVPTTYVWSRGDTFLGRAAAEATAAFVTADYRFAEIEGDHWLPDSQPELMAEFVLERVRSVEPVGAR